MQKIFISLILATFTSFPILAKTIRVLALDQTIAERKLSVGYNGKSKPIKGMHHFKRSEPITIPAKSGKLHLIANDRLSDENKPHSIDLTIPEDIKEPLLLILPDEAAPTGIKVHVIDDSLIHFGWGTLNIVNASGIALTFKHEDNETLIPSDLQSTIISPAGKNRNMGVSFDETAEDLKVAQLYSAIWKHREDLRQLVFIIPSKDKSKGKLVLNFITENKAVFDAKKAEEKEAE